MRCAADDSEQQLGRPYDGCALRGEAVRDSRHGCRVGWGNPVLSGGLGAGFLYIIRSNRWPCLLRLWGHREGNTPAEYEIKGNCVPCELGGVSGVRLDGCRGSSGAQSEVSALSLIHI